MAELHQLLPRELHDEYMTDATVCAIFKRAVTIGQSREAALIECVKAVLACKAELVTAYTKAAALTPTVLHFEGPPPSWLVQAVDDERAKRTPDAAPITVHLLSEGRPLCRKPGLDLVVPGKWEPGHRWVSAHSDDLGPRSAANCTECLAAVTEREP